MGSLVWLSLFAYAARSISQKEAHIEMRRNAKKELLYHLRTEKDQDLRVHLHAQYYQGHLCSTLCFTGPDDKRS